jgi:hypothetical protein
MKSIDVRQSQLRGYLREFFVKPDLASPAWAVAKACMGNSSQRIFGIKFQNEALMRQFGQAVLLSCGVRYNWHAAQSYAVLQDNLAGKMLITDYMPFDVVFIIHDRGTMKNQIMGQTLNQVAILREGSKKTFFFDLGGYPLPDLVFPIRPFDDSRPRVFPSMGSASSVGGRVAIEEML